MTEATTATDRWAWLREHTPVLADTVYLNAGFQGAISQPVADAMHAWLDRELREGPTSRPILEARRAMSTRYREVVAQAFGADPDEIAITDNTTHGMNMVTAGLPVEAGDGVVTTAIEHASGLVPAYVLRERHGAELHMVPIAPDDSPGSMLEAFARSVDARSRLVLISGVSYSTGQRLPVREIAALTHEANEAAVVLIDGAQTAGHEPLDLHASGVDAYAIPMHKWLCGPGGLGALYIRRDRIADVQPAAVSRHAAATFDFTGGYSEARDSIEKFELTTVSGVLLAGGIAAVEQYLETGPQALWDRVRALTPPPRRASGVSRASRSPVRSATPPAPASSPSAPRASIRRCWRRSCGCPAASSAARSPRPRRCGCRCTATTTRTTSRWSRGLSRRRSPRVSHPRRRRPPQPRRRCSRCSSTIATARFAGRARRRTHRFSALRFSTTPSVTTSVPTSESGTNWGVGWSMLSTSSAAVGDNGSMDTPMSPVAALRRVAFLLELAGEPSHRASAFRRAADAIAALPPEEVEARAEGRDAPPAVRRRRHHRSHHRRGARRRGAGVPPTARGRARAGLDASGRGAVRRAQGRLPRALGLVDGGASIREMADAAIELGHEWIVLTDHSPSLKVARGLSPERLREQLDVVAALNEELAPFRILTGIEVDILADGALDQEDELLARLDVVVGSLHSLLRMERKPMTKRMLAAIANPHLDVLGHCTGRMKTARRDRPESEFDAAEVFAACVRYDKAVEINSLPPRRDPPRRLMRQALSWAAASPSTATRTRRASSRGSSSAPTAPQSAKCPPSAS